MPYSTPWHAMASSAPNYQGQFGSPLTNTINFPNAVLTTSGSTAPAEWARPSEADSVSVQADGSLLILAGILRIRVPVHLFKDLVTLAEMELVKRLAPEPVEAEG